MTPFVEKMAVGGSSRRSSAMVAVRPPETVECPAATDP